MIQNGMLMEFVERWHPETLSSHLPRCDITITLDDIACLMHIPIRGILLSHGTQLFVDTSSSYTNVVYLTYLSNIALVREYNWGAATLEYTYHKLGEECLWKGLILQHFPDIIGWGEVSDYTESMPRARAFVPLRGNRVSDPNRHCLNRMAAEDFRYKFYDDHRETVLWDDIALYSGWLAAISTIIVRYLLERVMRQFSYQQTISRHPSDSAYIAMTSQQLDDVFVDWEHHIVPDEARETRSEVDWSYVNGYINWYYRVSHSYMIPTAPGSPPRPAHEEILRTYQTQLNHTQDVLPWCRQIADMGRACIANGFFPERSNDRCVVDGMIRLAKETFL
ncbi:uncharacterized protein LOC131605002 [Vicia villosa]|uniref:uncharacterized protein LOC131605002 n=1 Tax=Vicia villosa TaxID=3911 RepID=UPI00273B5141|nr:uncharacterized protein LOC131605002 [Vicia villosa]